MKQVLRSFDTPPSHWVGNGFPVRSLFSYDRHGNDISPFLLLDHAGPTDFEPANTRRGVGEHPHRGFETVTIIYDGEVEHRDSTGSGGRIGPGDVQWMTAGSGVQHEEFHSPRFTQTGGRLHSVQLWVNLRARDKMVAPRYQTLRAQDIPNLQLPGGQLRLIAGQYANRSGPAQTLSPVDLWDLRIEAGQTMTLDFAAGRTACIINLQGRLTLSTPGSSAAATTLSDSQWALLNREAGTLNLTADASGPVCALALGGEPLNEPIAGYGPFVMNTKAEIAAAIEDFNAGRFARLRPVGGD